MIVDGPVRPLLRLFVTKGWGVCGVIAYALDQLDPALQWATWHRHGKRAAPEWPGRATLDTTAGPTG